MNNKSLKPGNNAPKTAEYVPLTKNGEKDGKTKQVKQGQSLPPTQHSGSNYKIKK